MFNHLNEYEKFEMKNNLKALILMKIYYKNSKSNIIFTDKFKLICKVDNLYNKFDFKVEKFKLFEFLENQDTTFSSKFFNFFNSNTGYDIPDVFEFLSTSLNFNYKWSSCDMIVDSIREGYVDELSDYVSVDIPDNEESFIDVYGEDPYIIGLAFKICTKYLDILKRIYNPYNYCDEPYFFERDKTILMILNEDLYCNDDLMDLFLALIIILVEKQIG